MKDWKTTAAGIATAAFGFVAFSPETFQKWPWLVALAKYSTIGGLACMGILARDGTKKDN